MDDLELDVYTVTIREKDYCKQSANYLLWCSTKIYSNLIIHKNFNSKM